MTGPVRQAPQALARGYRLALRLFGGLFCIYLVGPLLVFVPLSFNDVALFHYPIETVSLRWYRDLLASSGWTRALLNSLFVACCSTLLVTLLGVCAAFGLWRARFPGKDFLMLVLMTPMIVPSVVGAIAMYFAFARFGLTNSYLGLILAHTALATPMTVVMISAVLARFDVRLLRAAASLGANPILAFRRVMLPLILPGVGGGAIFAFALSFDDVVAALFIAGPDQRTLPLEMYLRSTDLFDLTIAAAATIMLLVAVVLMVTLAVLRRRDALSAGRMNAAGV